MITRLLRGLMKAVILGASAGLRLWAQSPATTPVAARDLARGTVIVAADLRATSPADAERLAGWEVRRLLREGEPVKAPAVAPRALVQPNSSATLEATVAGVRVTRTVTVLGRGLLGDRVSIRLDPSRTVAAVVTGAGTVRLASGTDR